MIIDCHYHYFPGEFDVEKKLLCTFRGDGIDALGPYHVLYGSDGPYGTLQSDGSFDMQAEYEFATELIRAEELRAIRKNNFVFLTQAATLSR